MIVPTPHSLGPNRRNPLEINKERATCAAAKVGKPSNGTQISSNARQQVEPSSRQRERCAHHATYPSFIRWTTTGMLKTTRKESSQNWNQKMIR